MKSKTIAYFIYELFYIKFTIQTIQTSDKYYIFNTLKTNFEYVTVLIFYYWILDNIIFYLYVHVMCAKHTHTVALNYLTLN